MFNKLIAGNYSSRFKTRNYPALPKLHKVIFADSFKVVVGNKITILDNNTGNTIEGIVSAEKFAILDANTRNVLYKYTTLYNEDTSIKGYAIFSVNGTLLEDEKLIYDENLRMLIILKECWLY